MYYVPDGYQRKKPSRWYASLLIALIPLFIFSLVLNVITRVPDMYEWKFNKTIEAKQALEDGEELPLQTLEEAGIFVEPAEMAQQISDYMKGSADSFYAVNKTNELYDYYIGKAASFTDDDYGILDRVKLFDNITVVLGIMSFIASVMIFLVLVKGGYDTKALYRRKFVLVHGCNAWNYTGRFSIRIYSSGYRLCKSYSAGNTAGNCAFTDTRHSDIKECGAGYYSWLRYSVTCGYVCYMALHQIKRYI